MNYIVENKNKNKKRKIYYVYGNKHKYKIYSSVFLSEPLHSVTCVKVKVIFMYFSILEENAMISPAYQKYSCFFRPSKFVG